MDMTLADTSLSMTVVVKEILPECTGQQRNRLLDLGFVPGAEVTAEMQSPSGDPTAYRVKNSMIALRKEQASQIRVETMISEKKKQ